MRNETIGSEDLERRGMDMRRCGAVCLECYRVCTQTVRHCLTQGGHHVDEKHLTLVMDCAEICRASADLLTRSSVRHSLTCRICAEICDECARDCARFGDPQMDECVTACEQCARSCRAMISD